MMLTNITYKTIYFDEKINKFIEDQIDFRKEDVISITEDSKLTTMWYWFYEIGERA